MHPSISNWVATLKANFPKYFQGVNVLEVGARNVNGDVRGHFTEATFLGIDPLGGKNVDMKCCLHEAKLDGQKFDVVFSTSTLEHDPYWEKSLELMLRLTKDKGLLFATAAAYGYGEHGTRRKGRVHSPQPDYYKSIYCRDIADFLEKFRQSGCTWDRRDICFWGIR